MNLKYQRELLQQIAAGVNQLNRTEVANYMVTFKTDAESYDFSLPGALDALANDLYWDDRGNWADARIATVSSF